MIIYCRVLMLHQNLHIHLVVLMLINCPILSLVGVFPICSSKELELCNNISKKKGVANCSEIKCTAIACHLFCNTYSGKRVSKTNQAGQNPFDINAFCGIGKGHTAMEMLFGYMNCVPSMTYTTFRDMNNDIVTCYSKVAANNMLEALHELRGDINENVICDVAVSCDGTWQKSVFGFNGVVTIISVETLC